MSATLETLKSDVKAAESAQCPCRNLLSRLVKTNHHDDAIVFDVVTELTHRCRLCGRKFTVQMVPGDALLGAHEVSEGYDGRPTLSLSAARHAIAESVVSVPDNGGEWKPREDD